MDVATIFVGIATLCVIGFGVLTRGSWDRALHALATKRRLTFVSSGFAGTSSVQGELDGVDVVVKAVANNSPGRNRTKETMLSARLTLPSELSIRKESVGTALKRFAAGIADVQVGVPAFDDAVYLSGGNELQVVAMFNHEARTIITEALEAGAHVDGQRLIITKPGLTGKAEWLDEKLEFLVGKAKQLNSHYCRRAGVLPRLVDSVCNDPHPGYRKRAAELVFKHFRNERGVERAADALARAAEPELRLIGAAHIDPERGLSVAAALLGDPEVPRDVQAGACELLMRRFSSRAETRAALRRAVAGADGELAIAVLRGLWRLLEPIEGAQLEPHLTSSNPQIRSEAVSVLALGGRSAERRLIEILDSDDEIRLKVIGVLGDVASPAVVEPLTAYTKGVLRAGELKSAARQAIASIQARVEGGGTGQLSVSETDGGELSLNHQAQPATEEHDA